MGQSEAWQGGTTPYHMADRLLQLMDSWSIDRAGLVAMDMGAQPALAFAALHPDRVSFLVASNCLAFWDVETSWEIALLRRFKWNQLVLRRLPSAAFRRAERTFLPRGWELPAALRSDLWHCFSQKEVRQYIVRMCAGYQGTLQRLSELYCLISSPTLVLWADCDKHFPPAHALRLHASIPGSKLKIMKEAQHWMALYRPAEVADEILRYSDCL
jgi:pimeloyl-ACP methyl ester carboxylesterase